MKLLQKHLLYMCLFAVALFLTTTAVSKKNTDGDDDDASVEEISEEEYKEHEKQGSRHTHSTPDTGTQKKDSPQPETTKQDAKTPDAETQDVKTKDATTAGTPETSKTGTPPDAGKEESGKSQEKVEPEISEEEGDYELAQPPIDEEEEEEEEPEEEDEAPSGIRDPRPCEVCKYLAVELQGRLAETGKVKEFIETGHGIMPGDRKRKDYKKSELRFIEALHEPHVCEKILGYDIHAERKKSLRYAKGQSETRKTLHWLRSKGVKVDMGMPEEMWTGDGPSTEITHLQRLCIEMVEMHEEALEDWYWGHQEQHLYDYLCRDRALRHEDQECLKEELGAPEVKNEEDDGESENSKGDTGVPSNSMPPEGDPSSHAASADDIIASQTPSSDSATHKTEL